MRGGALRPGEGSALAVGTLVGSPRLARPDRPLAVSGFVACRRSGLRDRCGRAPQVLPSFVPDGLAELGQREPRPAFLPARDGYLLFAGALSPHKGMPVVLDRHRRLGRRRPLVLVGRGRGKRHGPAAEHLPGQRRAAPAGRRGDVPGGGRRAAQHLAGSSSDGGVGVPLVGAPRGRERDRRDPGDDPRRGDWTADAAGATSRP
jgi:hypothetical protein